MIVYGERWVVVGTYGRIAQLRREVRGALGGGGHDLVVGVLVGVGELEVGVVDRLFAECDGVDPEARSWREVALRVGHAVRCSWRGDSAGVRRWLEGVERGLAELAGMALPDEVEVGVHEGFAYYALYPETYREASADFLREVKPRMVVCIGVRSIGAALSAVVGAELEAAGCEVRSFTVRPRGHPFDRQVVASAELENTVRGAENNHFLIVDEGPGLSGSSFASIARWLLALGIPDDRIIFFPSWQTDGSGLVSDWARAHWSRFRQYTVSFESCWVESGRLIEGLPEGRLQDLSAGGWRALWYESEAEYPAVQPQHERRKYLLHPAGRGWQGVAGAAGGPGGDRAMQGTPGVRIGGKDAERPLLLKFAGLGHYGWGRSWQQESLAAAGFSPPVRGLQHGFDISEFSPGRPVRRGEVDRELLGTMARYLAYRHEHFPSDRGVPFDALVEMIRHNAVTGLGGGVEGVLGWLDGLRGRVGSRGTVAIDGRMLPHEWLRTSGGYLKVDGVDHHADHFFPGCQDIAWDLAGAVVECELGSEAERVLLNDYQTLSGDDGVDDVLPFYRVAYLAFRLGYATLALGAVGAGPEARRHAYAVRRYGVLLRRALGGGERGRPG